MISSRVVLCLSLLFVVGSPGEAQRAAWDIRGRIQLDQDPGRGVAVDLELCDPDSGRVLETLSLTPDSTRPYWFRENLPAHLRPSDLQVRLVVNSPQGYVSAQPDYFRKGGKPLLFKPLVLRKTAAAYPGWLKAARDAGRSRPDWGIRRLERLEDWDLTPEHRLQITMLKAKILADGNRWKKQQELLRDAFPTAGFQGIAKHLVADYFRLRFTGFARLIPQDFAGSVLQKPDLLELWERLVLDFAGQYASCQLDAAVAAVIDELTPDIILLQRKTLKTWLGRPGTTVNECG
jgi:hypothetical protein